MHGENYEWTQMYKEYAETARQEGLDNIADLFEKVGDIEKEHESRFKLFVNKLTDGSLFTSCGETVWLCRNCGHIHSRILSCLQKTAGIFSAKGRQHSVLACKKQRSGSIRYVTVAPCILSGFTEFTHIDGYTQFSLALLTAM